MKLIETKTLGTAAASIEFTSIPQTFTDLVCLISSRSNRAAVNDDLRIRLNGATTDLTSRVLNGDGSAAVSYSDTTWDSLAIQSAASSTSNTFGNSQVYISDYRGATNKVISVDSVSENNATAATQRLAAGLWSNTAAITSVLFSPVLGTDFVAGTTISLYGITKGSDGIVTTS